MIGELYASQTPDSDMFDSLIGSGSGLGVSIAKAFVLVRDLDRDRRPPARARPRLDLLPQMASSRRHPRRVGAHGRTLDAATCPAASAVRCRCSSRRPAASTTSRHRAWHRSRSPLGAMVASLAPAGHVRRRVGILAVSLRACSSPLARVFLGAAYPLAALYAVLLGFSVAFVVFGLFAPDESFPVSYTRGGQCRAPRSRRARAPPPSSRRCRRSSGLTVTEVKAFGDEGSGGSTPLLMTLEDGRRIFGKILATSHVRADRWYRIGRTILYGRLEDETTFCSVRKLIEYEDYAIRVLDDDGLHGRAHLRDRRAHARPRVPARDRVLRGRRDARAMPMSTIR